MNETFTLRRTWLRKNSGIFIQRSEIHRWGVFASRRIEQYEILEEAPYFSVPVNELAEAPTCDRYSYGFDQDTSIIGLGNAGLYNHSSSPNADYEFDKVNEVIRHYALKAIATGEEITIDYGESNVNLYNLTE